MEAQRGAQNEPPDETQRRDGSKEHGRAGETQTPADIPAASWWQIGKRAYVSITRDRVITIAAGVTFYSLLALFPGIAALVSLYGLFADAGTITDQVGVLSTLIPGGGVEIITDEVKRITSQGHGALGTGFFIGLATSLWSANAGVKSMFDALNVVYEEDESRGFIKLTALSLTFTLASLVLMMVMLAALVVVPVVLNYVGLSSALEWILTLARWPILLGLIVLALAVLYRFGPSRRKAKWRWVTPGSLFAAVAWIATSMLFSWYVSHFGSYNKTYGSLGAAIGFMTWIWISAVVILFGGEINAQVERQAEVDTTVGQPKPRGERGAKVADEPPPR